MQLASQLSSRFAPRSPVLRSETPLSEEQIRAVAPSIFAEAPHGSRSERYSYIPTATLLQELRGEGFQPFMVCQTRVRQDDRRDLWSGFNRTQENLTNGGLHGRAANRRRQQTRPVQGTVRARRWYGEGDVRGYRPPRGWTARADLTDIHPIAGRALPRAAWWIIETKE